MKKLLSIFADLVTVAVTMVFGVAPVSAQDGSGLTVPHHKGNIVTLIQLQQLILPENFLLSPRLKLVTLLP